MQNTEPGRGEEISRDETDMDPTQSQAQSRRGERREGEGLFGGYQGPERRSGADRRVGA